VNDGGGPSFGCSFAFSLYEEFSVLSDKHAELEESRKPKAAKLAKFQSRHKELNKKVVDIKARLAREHKTLANLTAQRFFVGGEYRWIRIWFTFLCRWCDTTLF
jgi:hypothetical protein